MTLDIDTAIAGAERTEAARRLIDRARDDGLVNLAVLSALDLCVLGGPAHPLSDEAVARAWRRLGDRQRKKVLDAVTESMLGRGLLIDEGLRTSAQPRSGSTASTARRCSSMRRPGTCCSRAGRSLTRTR